MFFLFSFSSSSFFLGGRPQIKLFKVLRGPIANQEGGLKREKARAILSNTSDKSSPAFFGKFRVCGGGGVISGCRYATRIRRVVEGV